MLHIVVMLWRFEGSFSNFYSRNIEYGVGHIEERDQIYAFLGARILQHHKHKNISHWKKRLKLY